MDLDNPNVICLAPALTSGLSGTHGIGGYRLSDRLSLGVGVSALYTNFEETIAINNNFVPGPVMVCDSKVKLENMDDWS